jgi:disulfide bond formation protein DsbB
MLRTLSLFGLIICAVVLISAIYLEYAYMLASCPLCILQRMVYVAIGAVFLIGTIFRISGIAGYFYIGLNILLASIGTAIATRQFWLQYFAPPQKVSCAADLQHLMSMYPILEALKIALQGSGECAKVDFTILTISFAGWSLFLFGTLVILWFYMLYKYSKGFR